jgi:hypothetical protein
VAVPKTPEEKRLSLRDANRRSRLKARRAAKARGETETFKVGHYVVKERTTVSEYAEKLSEIPPDTRSVTGLVMGDPLPGDRRRQKYVGVGYQAGRK